MFKGEGSSARTDVWAFGMTIYRLLHGNTWYSASPPPQALVPHGGFAQKLKWLPHIPKSWRSFIRRALHDDPQRRYRDANELLNAMATLSTVPTWSCTQSVGEINWSRTKGQRLVRVSLKRQPSGKFEWAAWSEPLDAGRRRTLGGSNGPVNYAAADRQLKEFFSKQT